MTDVCFALLPYNDEKQNSLQFSKMARKSAMLLAGDARILRGGHKEDGLAQAHGGGQGICQAGGECLNEVSLQTTLP